MNQFFIPWLLAALGLLAGALGVWRWIANIRCRRAALRRAHGYSMIHSLRAYSAWVECQRDLPFTARSLDELMSPEPLMRAREIKRDWFPSLSHHMAGLLQAHTRVIEYLWQQDLLRLSQGSGWRPAYEDPQYQQLRGAQEELIDDMIVACRELIGDSDRGWQRTGSDFSFSSSNNTGAPPSRDTTA